jgi:hypothetical protein
LNFFLHGPKILGGVLRLFPQKTLANWRNFSQKGVNPPPPPLNTPLLVTPLTLPELLSYILIEQYIGYLSHKLLGIHMTTLLMCFDCKPKLASIIHATKYTIKKPANFQFFPSRSTFDLSSLLQSNLHLVIKSLKNTETRFFVENPRV